MERRRYIPEPAMIEAGWVEEGKDGIVVRGGEICNFLQRLLKKG